MADIIFAAGFTEDGVALTSTELTGGDAPTVSIVRVTRSDNSEATVVTDQATTYSTVAKTWRYRLASADTETYEYYALFTTTYATADALDVWARGAIGAGQYDTNLDRIDDDVSSRAAPGAEMDLVDAPNATAITAIQAGLSTLVAGAEMDLVDSPNATAVAAIQAGLSTLVAGAEMDLVDAPNATAITAIQSGLATLTALTNLQSHGDSNWATAVVAGMALEATLTAMKGVGWSDETLAAIKALLDSPGSYMADVSALALEATLTAMKGVGWGAESLKSIQAYLASPDQYKADVSALGTPANFMADVSALATTAQMNARTLLAASYFNAVTDAVSVGSMAAALDVYQAKIEFFDDEGGTTDRYIVIWHKNGAPATTGITLPKIQVVKVADGTDLVAETAMAEIGSTGTYRYTEATNRQTSGQAYLAIATATIASSVRTSIGSFGRDSE